MEFDSLVTNTNTTPAYTQRKPEAPTTDGDASSSSQKINPSTSKFGKKLEPHEVRAEDKKELLNENTITEDEIKNTIERANLKIKPTFTEFQYRIHEKTNTVMIKVINSNTKEVIREIPPEKALDALAKMWELVGILVDTQG